MYPLQYNRFSQLRAPIAVNLEVTDKCNMHCSFCYNAVSSYQIMHSGSSASGGCDKQIRFDENRKQDIFHLLDILARDDIFEIRLFGGEFTVYKYWRDILRYAHIKGFFISFVSNGYLLSNDDALLLAECGVKDCTISLHGLEKEHDRITHRSGSFCRATEAIKHLQNQNITVNIAYTPNKENLFGLYAFVRLMSTEYSINNFSISRLFTDSRYIHLDLCDYHYLLKEIDRCHQTLGVNISLADSFPRCQVPIKYWRYLSYCSQGVGFAQVDFMGNLKHCSGTSLPLGNLFETALHELWSQKLDKLRNLEYLPMSCKICPIFCGGGCTVSRGVENKFAPDEFISQPNEEHLIQTFAKTVSNYTKSFLFNLLFSPQRMQAPKKLHEYPQIVQRFKIREETNGAFLVMFEQSGTKVLSGLAAYVLSFLDGSHALQSIFEECRLKFPDCSEAEVSEIIQSLI